MCDRCPAAVNLTVAQDDSTVCHPCIDMTRWVQHHHLTAIGAQTLNRRLRKIPPGAEIAICVGDAAFLRGVDIVRVARTIRDGHFKEVVICGDDSHIFTMMIEGGLEILAHRECVR